MNDQPTNNDQVQPQREPRQCPICGGSVPADGADYPFCSRRCRYVDLGRWFDGGYLSSRPLDATDDEQDN
jgi:hypothetical protein